MIIDVIIPVLNEANNLKKLIPYLKTVCKLNAANVVVVDCCNSIDDSESLCKSHDIVYLKAKATCRSHQLNEGAKRTEGDVLLFLHADVIPPPNILSMIKDAIEKGFQFGFFSFKFDSPKYLLKINSYFTKFDGVFAGGGDQCQFFTRSFFSKLNGYNEDFVIMEDFEIFKRIKACKANYKVIDSPVLVSDRKYQKNSYIRVSIVNLIAFIKFKRNICPKKLKLFYNKWLN